MNCEICGKSYNLKNRLPMNLPCCGETLCNECAKTLEKAPQENNVCPFKQCKFDCYTPGNLRVNKGLQKIIQSCLGIYCDQHISQYAEYYCQVDKTLVCANCAILKHKNHKTEQVKKETLIENNNKAIDILKSFTEKIHKHIESIMEFQESKRDFTSVQYSKMKSQTEEYLKIINGFEKQDQKKKVHKVVDFNILEDLRPAPQLNPQLQIIIKDSTLIRTPYDKQFIQSLFAHKHNDSIQFKLLYRGSQDKFKTQEFHQKCDKKGPTLTVVKSEYGHVFGGFTLIPWDSPATLKKFKDPEAFMFSLTRRVKYNQKPDCQTSVQHWGRYGPIFGIGDLIISPYFSTQRTNYSKLGECYHNPNRPNNGYIKPAFKVSFRVKEIEVFKVIF